MNKSTVTYRIKRALIGSVASLVFLSVANVSWADTWTGTVDDLWSTNGNWLDGSAPTSTDSVTFNSGDTGGTNFVDTNFTITGLEYLINGTHTTNLNSGITLQVDQYLSLGFRKHHQ